MKRKYLSILCVLLAFLLVLAGCGSGSGGSTASTGGDEAGDGEWKWERKVTIVVPWGVGGGADGTVRPMQPLLQVILGVPVEIVNVEGAGGANGADYVYKQPADGYTYLLGTQSHIMLDLQKILPEDWRADFQPVCKLVHSINIIASSKKAQEGKYSNFTEFLDYAKAHPQELVCGMQTATGADGVSLKETLAGGLGVDITEIEEYIKIVNYSSGSELSAAMAGGHVNICITGTDEIKGLIESGDIVPLVAISENRMTAFPDVQCTGELGIDSYVGTWRALYCRTGTPQEAIDSFTEAVEEAWNDPTYQEFLKNASYLDREGFAPADELQALQDEEYVAFEEYLTAAGLI